MATATARKALTPQRDLQKDLAAATALKEQLKTILGDDNLDAETLRDMVEGETGLFEAVDGVLQQIADDTARCDGIEKFQSTLGARKSRLEARIKTLRAMLTNTMDMLGEKKMERPIATVSLKPVPPKLNVVEESEVPTQYWKTPEPVLDRKTLGDALKARSEAIEQLEAAYPDGAPAPTHPDYSAYRTRFDAMMATHPMIPGAELDNGSITVAIRFG